MIRVALDAMGGDHAPAAEVEGASLALRDLGTDFIVQLVGRPEVLEAELAKHPEIDRARIEIVPASDVVTTRRGERATREPTRRPLPWTMFLRKSSVSETNSNHRVATTFVPKVDSTPIPTLQS